MQLNYGKVILNENEITVNNNCKSMAFPICSNEDQLLILIWHSLTSYAKLLPEENQYQYQ